MQGTKPEHVVERGTDTLDGLEIHPPRQATTNQTQLTPATPSQSVQVKPEVVRRFEERMQRELEGSSFSQAVERSVGVSRVGQARRNKETSATPSATRALSKAKRAGDSPFEGLTILDKVVSFVAYLLKSLEKKLLGGPRKLLPLRKPRKSALTKEPAVNEEQSLDAAKKTKVGTKTLQTKKPMRGPMFQG
ncbi:MAG: hypothetical protein EBZ48_02360 [Proteobacteria bacterium]|nr:hypothetical protein [Pseudomonadota bacterium]